MAIPTSSPLQTPLCDLLGIDVPILKAPMAGGTDTVDLVAAVTALTFTPAAVLGRADDLGTLRPGRLADLVLLSPALAVQRVLAAGAPL